MKETAFTPQNGLLAVGAIAGLAFGGTAFKKLVVKANGAPDLVKKVVGHPCMLAV